jgi:hypothetical protein
LKYMHTAGMLHRDMKVLICDKFPIRRFISDSEFLV